MYYITTKTGAGKQVRILATEEKRDAARALAKELGGTVRDQAGIDLLRSLNQLDTEVASKPAKAKPAPTVVQVEKKPEGSNPWLALAVDASKAKRNTRNLGAKAKAPKRVATAPELIEAAAEYVSSEFPDANKVDTVRALAVWCDEDGHQLQRRDVLAIVQRQWPGIAAATVATQFQLVRSGTLQYTGRYGAKGMEFARVDK